MPINLAIHAMLDQYTELRAGGLYWVTADQLTDARHLAQQFLQAMPEDVSATLISCVDPVESIISTMDPQRGPHTLRLFEMAAPQISRGLADLTRDLGRAGVKNASQILLLAPTQGWAKLQTAKDFARWCEGLRQWLRAHNATLLIISHGESLLLHERLLPLDETLSGLSHLSRHKDDICYRLFFWHNDRGVSAGCEFKLADIDNVLTLIPEASLDVRTPVADDQYVYLADRAVLEDTPAPSRHWRLFPNLASLCEAATNAQAATVIVAMDNNLPLIELAQHLLDVREHCGPALKIVVREMEPAVRYRDDELLLVSGANLVVPYGTPLSRFLNMLESVQGQRWQFTRHPDLASLLERQRPPHVRGLVSAHQFVTTVRQVYSQSSDVTHQLIRFEPVPGLSDELILSQMQLRRYGDFACLFGGHLFVFLFACRDDGLQPALANIFRLPWRDMFSGLQRLDGPQALPEEALIQATALPQYASHALSDTTIPLRPAGNRPPLAPQLMTLPIAEPHHDVS